MTPHTRTGSLVSELIGAEESKRAGQMSTGSILPLAHGKDVVFAQGTEITASIDGNVHLKRASFQPPKSTVGPAPAVSNPPQLL